MAATCGSTVTVKSPYKLRGPRSPKHIDVSIVFRFIFIFVFVTLLYYYYLTFVNCQCLCYLLVGMLCIVVTVLAQVDYSRVIKNTDLILLQFNLVINQSGQCPCNE